MVDRLERELEGQAQVVRLSVLDPVGSEIARQHNVASLPTFLIFDGDGNLIERQIGIPDRARIKALIANPTSEPRQVPS
jgi:thioredoxin-related protein